MNIVFPWPPADLSPNARVHWAKLARAKKTYRMACFAQAHVQGIKPAQAERVAVHLTFVPPDRRKRDLDNLIASMKAGIDGLADAMRLDDSKFRLTFELDHNAIGGMVRVTVTP